MASLTEKDSSANDETELVPTALDIPHDGENPGELADVDEVVEILLDIGLDQGHEGIQRIYAKITQRCFGAC